MRHSSIGKPPPHGSHPRRLAPKQPHAVRDRHAEATSTSRPTRFSPMERRRPPSLQNATFRISRPSTCCAARCCRTTGTPACPPNTCGSRFASPHSWAWTPPGRSPSRPASTANAAPPGPPLRPSPAPVWIWRTLSRAWHWCCTPRISPPCSATRCRRRRFRKHIAGAPQGLHLRGATPDSNGCLQRRRTSRRRSHACPTCASRGPGTMSN
mmetsp:Transcript_115159/g.332667  ORF Transcript_115159/g.332667 Transcript_115159/m.332667 type:complete len:211 (+) Transcript_115159:421-1053(+)